MLNRLRLRLRALFFKSKMEDELQAELQFHLEREIEENIIRGMTPEEARYAAIRSFGGVERVREESRDVRGIRLLEELWQDLRFGMRMLLKNSIRSRFSIWIEGPWITIPSESPTSRMSTPQASSRRAKAAS